MNQEYLITINASDAKEKIKQALNEEVKAGYINSFSIEDLDFKKRLEMSKASDMY
jgi:hypothetical protein